MYHLWYNATKHLFLSGCPHIAADYTVNCVCDNDTVLSRLAGVAVGRLLYVRFGAEAWL